MKIHPYKQCNANSRDERTQKRGTLDAKTPLNLAILNQTAWMSMLSVALMKKSLAYSSIFFLIVSSIASKSLSRADEGVSISPRSTLVTETDRSLATENLPELPQDNPADLTADIALDPEAKAERDDSEFFSEHQQRHNPQAVTLLKRVLQQLVHGPAFHCKVRETVWTNDREVIGVGTYEQAGQGTGRYHLQVTMHDGSGQHRLKQISDGRLAWTRTEIASGITLKRVDVGRLEEWVGKSETNSLIAPRYTVGAWVELLTTIYRDYNLDLVSATLDGKPVWVIKGEISSRRRVEIMSQGDRTTWPMLLPTRVHVAIASGMGNSVEIAKLLPLRFEFWSDPLQTTLVEGRDAADSGPAETNSRLITLIELYSIQPIIAPPVERFRFENQEAEVNFINETDRYIQMHGIQLTERERIRLRR